MESANQVFLFIYFVRKREIAFQLTFLCLCEGKLFQEFPFNVQCISFHVIIFQFLPNSNDATTILVCHKF